MFKLFKNQYFWLGIILLLALLVRLYRIDAPIADWHSWRQADTAAVTRNFIKEGFNPLFPRYDDMSGVSEKPLINTERFRFVEFPIYNIFVYPLFLIFGSFDIYQRLISVFFSLGSIIFVYLISKKYLDSATSLISAFIYALLPFNVFFSRVVLPEPTFIFFALGMVYFLDKYILGIKDNLLTRRYIWAVWGLIFTSTAFLIKPWAIFFIPPLIYSALKNVKNRSTLIKYGAFFLIALIPFILWRFWILQQPQGIPASSWLLNGDGIRFRPAFFWWLVSERLGREILGVCGFAFLIIGFIIKPQRNYFLHVFLLSMCAYFTIVATGNVRHNYYQSLAVPVLSIFTAIGFSFLIRGANYIIPRIWSIPLALLFLILTFYFTYKVNIEFYKINNPAIVEAGNIADKLLPKDAIVLAPYNGDTAFLYQTNRVGFPNAYLPLKQMVADYGVTHFISVSKDIKTKWVMRHFKVLVDEEKFIIVDVTQLIEPFDEKSDPEP